MTRWILIVVVSASSPACHRAPKNAPLADIPAKLAATSATAALTVFDSMDARVAVPLLPMMANHQKQNMRDHLAVVQEIVIAVGSKDFDAIEHAARRIGYSEQMGLMCTHMGAGAPGFTEQALRFHHTADKISEAAGAHDMPGVLSGSGRRSRRAQDATQSSSNGSSTTRPGHRSRIRHPRTIPKTEHDIPARIAQFGPLISRATVLVSALQRASTSGDGPGTLQSWRPQKPETPRRFPAILTPGTTRRGWPLQCLGWVAYESLPSNVSDSWVSGSLLRGRRR